MRRTSCRASSGIPIEEFPLGADISWYVLHSTHSLTSYIINISDGQHGPPGTGKTSIVHSLAGELGLNIYIISLGKNGMDDRTLNACISSLPEKCIALIEDIDAAFTSRALGDQEAGDQNSNFDYDRRTDGTDKNQTRSQVTLSGLRAFLIKSVLFPVTKQKHYCFVNSERSGRYRRPRRQTFIRHH